MNKFEVDSKGKVFINGMLIDRVYEYNINAVGHGISEITVKFGADEVGIRTTKKAADVNMNFGQAIEALKQGKKVARAGWNGKGMFLYLVKGTELQKSLEYGYGEYENEPTITSSIAMKTAQNTIVIGWLASQTDMLAEDWTIV